jgi:hypothetical protein
VPRKALLQCSDQRLGRQNLAYRNGVNPNGTALASGSSPSRDFWWQAAQPFAQQAPRLAPRPSPQGVVRRENEHACSCQEAIEEVHGEGESRLTTFRRAKRVL